MNKPLSDWSDVEVKDRIMQLSLDGYAVRAQYIVLLRGSAAATKEGDKAKVALAFELNRNAKTSERIHLMVDYYLTELAYREVNAMHSESDKQ